MRPEALRWDVFAERQLRRIDDALDALERRWSTDLGEVTAGTVAAACALSYLDFRLAARPWRKNRPLLAAFYETFARRPSMTASELANPT
jgi:glutathione S-transferase